MKYSPHNLIKRRARQLANAQGISLSLALEQLARESGFAHNYEMARVAKREPNDDRLLRGAFGFSSLAEAIYADPVYTNFLELIEDEMSGAIADTNGEDYSVEDLDVLSTRYDADRGLLTLTLSFEYSGYQMPDKPWSGNAFYIHQALLRLHWGQDGWELSDEDTFEVLESDTDRDRDYEQQRVEGLS